MAGAGIYLVDEASVESERAAGDTASRRVTLDARVGCPRLEQSVVRFAPGRSLERAHEGAHTVL